MRMMSINASWEITIVRAERSRSSSMPSTSSDLSRASYTILQYSSGG